MSFSTQGCKWEELRLLVKKMSIFVGENPFLRGKCVGDGGGIGVKLSVRRLRSIIRPRVQVLFPQRGCFAFMSPHM